MARRYARAHAGSSFAAPLHRDATNSDTDIPAKQQKLTSSQSSSASISSGSGPRRAALTICDRTSTSFRPRSCKTFELCSNPRRRLHSACVLSLLLDCFISEPRALTRPSSLLRMFGSRPRRSTLTSCCAVTRRKRPPKKNTKTRSSLHSCTLMPFLSVRFSSQFWFRTSAGRRRKLTFLHR